MRTWNVPSDISEAKHFAIAIYNITTLGSIGYFLGNFLQLTNPGIGILLRCLGISSSSAVASLIIMGPKLLLSHGLFENVCGMNIRAMLKKAVNYSTSPQTSDASASKLSSSNNNSHNSSNHEDGANHKYGNEISPELIQAFGADLRASISPTSTFPQAENASSAHTNINIIDNDKPISHQADPNNFGLRLKISPEENDVLATTATKVSAANYEVSNVAVGGLTIQSFSE